MTEHSPALPPVKTRKREMAAVILAAFWFLVACISRQGYPPDGVELVRGLAPWVHGFAGAAFGMDWLTKQTDIPARISGR